MLTVRSSLLQNGKYNIEIVKHTIFTTQSRVKLILLLVE